jgi:hypothetical protein
VSAVDCAETAAATTYAAAGNTARGTCFIDSS